MRDLAGSQKFNFQMRGMCWSGLQRGNGARVAAGAFAKLLLKEFGTEIASHVIQVGHVRLERAAKWEEIRAVRGYGFAAAVRGRGSAGKDEGGSGCGAEGRRLRWAGCLRLWRTRFRWGLGSHAQWDEKLDGRLAQALMSVQAVKGVEIGAGILAAGSYGSEVQDEISYDKAGRRFRRSSQSGWWFGRRNHERRGRGDSRILEAISTLRKALARRTW